MKTINFLTTHFIPEISPCTNRVLPFIMELQKTFHVNVICLTEKGKEESSTRVKYSDHITIYYVNQKDFDGSDFFVRAWNELKYVVKLVRLANEQKSDITFITSPYMFLIPVTAYMVKGKKLLDNRDLVWEYLEESTFLKKSIKSFLKYIMKRSMKRYDQVIVTNESEQKILIDHYGLNDMLVIPNGISQARFDNLSNIKMVDQEQLTITYVGTVGIAQNLLVFTKTAQLFPDIRFLIIGDGLDLPNLRRYIDENNITNVILTGKLSWEEVERYYTETSILYAQLEDKYISAMPSKLYEYASIGLPIIYGGTGQALSFIAKLTNSIAIRPNSIDEFSNAITHILTQARSASDENKTVVRQSFIRDEAAKSIAHTIQSHTK